MKKIALSSVTKFAAFSALVWSSAGSAATVAYYDFEEGSNGTAINTNNLTGDRIGSSSTVTDNGDGTNGLKAYNGSASPNYSNTTLAPTSFSNTMAMEFDGGDDLFIGDTGTSTWANAAYTDFTIETYVRFGALGGFQTLVGRDDSGNPGQGTDAKSLFYLSKGDTENFRVELITNSNTNVQVNSSFTASIKTWYHVAAVGDATAGTLELFINGVSVGSTIGYTGLFNPAPDTVWTLGRGQYAGNVGDYLNGYLDEVRFSDVALSSDQFLNAVPEPSTYALLFGLTALTWIAMRRRKA